MDKEKRNIKPIIEKTEENYLPNVLSDDDFKDFKQMANEFRDTWNKKQIYRTETEIRFSVLQDNKYPTKAAKYWQAVREQNSFLHSLMRTSFEARKNDLKIKWLREKIEKEKDWYKLENYKIDLDEKIFAKANMELEARDRMRELRLWSQIKKELDDGSFDTKDVNTHQLESYHIEYKNKIRHVNHLTPPGEAFNIAGQLESIERIQKDGELGYNKKQEIGFDQNFGKKEQ